MENKNTNNINGKDIIIINVRIQNKLEKKIIKIKSKKLFIVTRVGIPNLNINEIYKRRNWRKRKGKIINKLLNIKFRYSTQILFKKIRKSINNNEKMKGKKILKKFNNIQLLLNKSM